MHWIDLILQFGPRQEREEGRQGWTLRAEWRGEREETFFEEPFDARQWRSVERARGRDQLPRSKGFQGGRGSVESSARDLGEILFSAVFTTPVSRLWERAQEVRQRPDEGVRIVIDLSAKAARRLGEHRWELLAEPGSKRILAREKNAAIVRRLASASSPLPKEPSPFRLLVLHGPQPELSGNSADEPEAARNAWLSFRQEAEGITALRSAGWEVETVTVSSRRELLRSLQGIEQRPIHGLHLIGHGGYDVTWDLGSLALGGEEGSIEDADLAQMLHRVEGLRFVFLNLCSGARGAESGGLAAQLSAVGIPAVLAAGRSIGGEAAKELALEFYRELGRGRRLVEALSEARLAVGGEVGHPLEWSAYQLFEAGESMALVTPGEKMGASDATVVGTLGSSAGSGGPALSSSPPNSLQYRPSVMRAFSKAIGVGLATLLLATYLLSYVGSWPPRPGYAGELPLLSLWPTAGDRTVGAGARDLPEKAPPIPSAASGDAEAAPSERQNQQLTLSTRDSEELWGGRWILNRAQLAGRWELSLSLLLPDGQVVERPIYGPGPLELGEESPWRVYVERVDPAQGEAAIIVSTP
ncbi:MAG: CHAT domain-containing protein [Acidobacteriota bacterium]